MTSKLLRRIAEEGKGFNNWLGFRIGQLPSDLVAYQDIIFRVKPNIIIETGFFRGGSSIFFASMLEMCGINGKVISIEIKPKTFEKEKVRKHRLGKRIQILSGSSIDDNIINKLRQMTRGKRVLVHLDSDHSTEHVLRELEKYSPLVSKGSYLIVADTGLEDIAPYAGYTKDNNPKVAVRKFLKNNDNFIIDKDFMSRFVVTSHPDGYLRRVK